MNKPRFFITDAPRTKPHSRKSPKELEEKNKALREARKRTQDLFSGELSSSNYPKEQEVIDKICIAENLSPKELQLIRGESIDKRSTFMEFRDRITSSTYIYYTKDYPNPDVQIPYQGRLPLRHAGSTILLKVDLSGMTEEMHRWEE